MTLVAGFLEQGVPILLGDFLVTVDGVRTGLVKKIHLIGPNFVIGWTGHLIAARTVLSDIYRQFADRKVTKDEVEQYLTTYPKDVFGSTSILLIGWIIDNEQHCFLWNSGYTEELFYKPYHYVGSGEKVFQAMIGDMDEASSINTASVGDAIDATLLFVSRLISDEILAQRNQRMGFGHAYEVLYFNGERFEYLDNILYLNWDFFFDDKSKITSNNLYKTIYKYRNFNNIAVIQIVDLVNRRVDIHAALPVFEIDSSILGPIFQDVSQGKPLPLASDYYCILCSLIGPGRSMTMVTMEIKSSDPQKGFSFEEANGQINVSLDFNLVEWMYRAIQEDKEKEKVESNQVIIRAGEKQADRPIVLSDLKVYALSIVAFRTIEDITHIENDALSTQVATREQAEDVALKLAQQKWPSDQGWQHRVSVQEITLHLDLRVNRMEPPPASSRPRRQKKKRRR